LRFQDVTKIYTYRESACLIANASIISCIPDFPLKNGPAFYGEIRNTGNYRKFLAMRFPDKHSKIKCKGLRRLWPLTFFVETSKFLNFRL
jgi:hypothetical protein